MRDLIVLDTTLRDGDQAAGCALSLPAKVLLASKLVECRVDIVEAGFPLASPCEYRACREIAAVLAGTSTALALMCRGIPSEIRDTAVLLKNPRSLLHISLPVSPIHIRNKFRLSPAEFLAMAATLIRHAGDCAAEIECGAEDATRGDPEFLCDYCETVIAAGAKVVNIADTLGLAAPEEIAALLELLRRRVKPFTNRQARLSVHCHNDRGLAVANTLAAIRSGADQIEVALCGLGERAGIAAEEEVLANLSVHPQLYDARSRIAMKPLLEGALQLCRQTGNPPPAGHPFLGSRTRAHAAGLHQDGLLKSVATYSQEDEFHRFVPERIVLSHHSGRAGIAILAAKCGIRLDAAAEDRILATLKSRGVRALGLTEFLECCHDQLPHSGPDILAVEDVREHSNKQLHQVSILRCDGKQFAGQGTGTFAALRDAVMNMSGNVIGCGRIELVMMDGVYRCYAELSVNSDPSVAVERFGAEPALLMAQCLFDALNFHLVREEEAS